MATRPLTTTEKIKLALSIGAAASALQGLYSFWQNKVDATNPTADEVFPTDLLRTDGLTNDLFFIKFQFKKYEKRSQDNSKIVRVTGPGIKLPIPKNLRDNLSVLYSGDPLGAVAGVATDILAGEPIRRNQVIREPTLLPQIPEIPSGISDALREAKNLADAYGVDQFGQTKPAQVLQALSGVAPNSFQTWLFKQPNFRNHNFSWTLTPESPEESDIIRTIVRLFQKNMLPAKQTGNNALFLQFPSLVYIQLFAGNPLNSAYLYDFKPCVLTSVSVDYAAAGRPAFFTSNNRLKKSGAPAAVNLSLQLQEIEFWTQDDFKDDFITNNITT